MLNLEKKLLEHFCPLKKLDFFTIKSKFPVLNGEEKNETLRAETASRNVAFKVARMRESIMEDQDELIIRKSDREDEALEAYDKATLEDVGYNADLW